MNDNILLAIVIPAYKSNFLEQTLESISNQTDKRFNLYIGDDNSPEHLYEIISKYKDKISIKYKHFENNLGGIDLVAQWERCIDMVQDEKYIWFFSDDDIMEETCVADFYHEYERNPYKALYHFNTKIINGSNKEICPQAYNKQFFPYHMTQKDYIMGRLYFNINSFAVEYVFKKSEFIRNGRFVKFDLAWGSDDATWIGLAKQDGIYTIKGSHVLWRSSDVNISPTKNHDIILRKLNATLLYLLYLKSNLDIIELKDAVYNYWLHSIYSSCKFISLDETRMLNDKFFTNFPVNPLKRLVLSFFNVFFHLF